MTDKQSESTTTIFQRARAEMETGNAIGLTLAGGAFAAATGSQAAIVLTAMAAVKAGVAIYNNLTLDRR